MTDVYKAISLIDLTDKSDKFNLLKYLLLDGYINDLRSPSKYKPECVDEKWLIKFLYMHYNTSAKHLLTKDQWHELIDFIWDVIPDNVKYSDRFGFSCKKFHKMVNSDAS